MELFSTKNINGGFVRAPRHPSMVPPPEEKLKYKKISPGSFYHKKEKKMANETPQNASLVEQQDDDEDEEYSPLRPGFFRRPVGCTGWVDDSSLDTTDNSAEASAIIPSVPTDNRGKDQQDISVMESILPSTSAIEAHSTGIQELEEVPESSVNDNAAESTLPENFIFVERGFEVVANEAEFNELRVGSLPKKIYPMAFLRDSDSKYSHSLVYREISQGHTNVRRIPPVPETTPLGNGLELCLASNLVFIDDNICRTRAQSQWVEKVKGYPCVGNVMIRRRLRGRIYDSTAPDTSIPETGTTGTEETAETEQTVESEEPAETEEPTETEEPAETEEPTETEEPAETEEPTEIEEMTHSDTSESSEDTQGANPNEPLHDTLETNNHKLSNEFDDEDKTASPGPSESSIIQPVDDLTNDSDISMAEDQPTASDQTSHAGTSESSKNTPESQSQEPSNVLLNKPPQTSSPPPELLVTMDPVNVIPDEPSKSPTHPVSRKNGEPSEAAKRNEKISRRNSGPAVNPHFLPKNRYYQMRGLQCKANRLFPNDQLDLLGEYTEDQRRSMMDGFEDQKNCNIANFLKRKEGPWMNPVKTRLFQLNNFKKAYAGLFPGRPYPDVLLRELSSLAPTHAAGHQQPPMTFPKGSFNLTKRSRLSGMSGNTRAPNTTFHHDVRAPEPQAGHSRWPSMMLSESGVGRGRFSQFGGVNGHGVGAPMLSGSTHPSSRLAPQGSNLRRPPESFPEGGVGRGRFSRIGGVNGHGVGAPILSGSTHPSSRLAPQGSNLRRPPESFPEGGVGRGRFSRIGGVNGHGVGAPILSGSTHPSSRLAPQGSNLRRSPESFPEGGVGRGRFSRIGGVNGHGVGAPILSGSTHPSSRLAPQGSNLRRPPESFPGGWGHYGAVGGSTWQFVRRFDVPSMFEQPEDSHATGDDEWNPFWY